jgi:hypothetical protein
VTRQDQRIKKVAAKLRKMHAADGMPIFQNVSDARLRANLERIFSISSRGAASVSMSITAAPYAVTVTVQGDRLADVEVVKTCVCLKCQVQRLVQ